MGRIVVEPYVECTVVGYSSGVAVVGLRNGHSVLGVTRDLCVVGPTKDRNVGGLHYGVVEVSKDHRVVLVIKDRTVVGHGKHHRVVVVTKDRSAARLSKHHRVVADRLSACRTATVVLDGQAVMSAMLAGKKNGNQL